MNGKDTVELTAQLSNLVKRKTSTVSIEEGRSTKAQCTHHNAIYERKNGRDKANTR